MHDVGLCTICSDPSLFFSHRRDRGVTGRQAGTRVVELITRACGAERCARTWSASATRDRRAGRDPDEVRDPGRGQVRAGRGARGARRGRDRRWWARTAPRTWSTRPTPYPGAFTWDFIGHLQSRKVRDCSRYVRYIHSVASDSVLAQLERHGDRRDRGPGRGQRRRRGGQERDRARELPAFLERCPVKVVGLMTMPPLAPEPEDSRRHFAALRELAGRARAGAAVDGDQPGLLVAVQEGATIVRLGTTPVPRSTRAS